MYIYLPEHFDSPVASPKYPGRQRSHWGPVVLKEQLIQVPISISQMDPSSDGMTFPKH